MVPPPGKSRGAGHLAPVGFGRPSEACQSPSPPLPLAVVEGPDAPATSSAAAADEWREGSDASPEPSVSAASASWHVQPPDRPKSAPPEWHPDGPSLFSWLPPGEEVHYRSWNGLDVPGRPHSAPGFDQDRDHPGHRSEDGSGATDEAEVTGWGVRQPVLDPKGNGLFAFPPAKLPSRLVPPSSSPVPSRAPQGALEAPRPVAGGPGDIDRIRSPFDVRSAQGSHSKDHRRTPPPTLGPVPEATVPARLASLTQSPSGQQTPTPPGLSSPGLHAPGVGGSLHSTGGGLSGDDNPQLLHPVTVRGAFEPLDIDRPMTAPPALDPGAYSLALQANFASSLPPDIRCDESYPEFYQRYAEQNVNLPKPIEPSPEIVRHRAGSIDASEFGQQGHPEGGGGEGASASGVAGGVSSFAAATGFDRCPTPSAPGFHGSHLPRSPSPPWDSALQAHSAAVAAAVAQQHAAGAQVPSQHLQQPPAMPVPTGPSQASTMLQGGGLTLPVPVPGGTNAPSGSAATAAALSVGGYAAVAAAAAWRHSPLLGAAGFPTAAGCCSFGEATASTAIPVPYSWQAALDPSNAAAAAAFAAEMAAAPSKGGLGAAGRCGGGQLTGVDGSNAGSRRDPAYGMQRSDGVQGQRGSEQSDSQVAQAGGSAGGGGGAAASSSGDQRRAQRGSGFKISHLEDMFASNTFVSNVYSIAKDQSGCRMLQHKLDEGNPEITNAIFNEVLANCTELFMDPFGNYLCQRLLDVCTPVQLQKIIEGVCGNVVRISLNMHGARAVQKLIDVVGNTPHIPRFVAALEGAVVTLANDANGNHVVQRCLEAWPPEAHGFIFRAVAAEVVAVSSHRQGCRIVQRCIDLAANADRLLIVGAVCRNALQLVQDPFGNYVVQYVLNLREPQVNSEVLSSLLGRLSVLSRQKFSAYVVEKCLQLCTPQERSFMIRELADPKHIGELLRDVYGNYVVQSALSLTPEPQLNFFLGAVKPVLPSLRSSGQGRRIAQKLEKKYPQLKAGSSLGSGTSGGGGGEASSGGACSSSCGCAPSAATAPTPMGGPCIMPPGAVPIGGPCLMPPRAIPGGGSHCIMAPGAVPGVALATPAPCSGFLAPCVMMPQPQQPPQHAAAPGSSAAGGGSAAQPPEEAHGDGVAAGRRQKRGGRRKGGGGQGGGP
mmetsp:Transcript_124105/g.356418  ORF Transcript_124105/g.356418 Transcript_124105/m.356418 type:complete len:1162 (+) Transcript_124105:89-3574(+)